MVRSLADADGDDDADDDDADDDDVHDDENYDSDDDEVMTMMQIIMSDWDGDARRDAARSTLSLTVDGRRFDKYLEKEFYVRVWCVAECCGLLASARYMS